MRGRGDPTIVIRNGTLIDAHEAEIMARLGGYAALEAIVAFTANGAFALGLEDEPGVLAEGRLADAIILDRDPLADIAVPRGDAHLTTVIKDGKVIDRAGRATANARLTFEDDAAPSTPAKVDPWTHTILSIRRTRTTGWSSMRANAWTSCSTTIARRAWSCRTSRSTRCFTSSSKTRRRWVTRCRRGRPWSA